MLDMEKIKKITVKASGEYDVLIGKGLLHSSGELIKEVLNPCKIAVITDDIVDRLYSETVIASLEGAGWGQGQGAGHHLPLRVWLSPSPWGGRSEMPGAPRLRPRLLPNGHWASARHSAPGLIPKQNIWFPGLMALKCKYCFAVSNKQSHTGSRSPELAAY